MVSIQRFPTLAAFLMLVVLLLATLAPRPALAEVITLKNNDRLTGEIVEQTEETLTLEHPTIGRIVVPKNDIKPKAVATQSDEALDDTMGRMGIKAESTHEKPKTEKKPAETVVEETQKAVPAEEEKQEVATGEEKQKLQEQGEEPVVVAQEEAELPPPTGIFGTRILQGWKRTIAVGLKGEEGDSVSQDWNFSLRGSYEDDYKKWDVKGVYIMETDDHKNSERKANVLILRDWFNPDSRWYNYAQLRYNYDRYKYWKHRVAPLGGRGYKIFWQHDLKLRLRAGLGGRRDWGTENDFNPEGEVGLQFDWRPLPLQRIEINSSFYPDFDDTGEYRTVSNLVWALRFSEDSAFTLRFGADHTYDSKINPHDDDERRYDLLYYGALGLDF
jgi:putative salt-induced outer membrane protein YdiY